MLRFTIALLIGVCLASPVFAGKCGRDCKCDERSTLDVYATDDYLLFRGTPEQITFFSWRFYELHASKTYPTPSRDEWDAKIGLAINRGMVMVFVATGDKSKATRFWRAFEDTKNMKPISPEYRSEK